MRVAPFLVLLAVLAASAPSAANAGISGWFGCKQVAHSSGGTICIENGRYLKDTFKKAMGWRPLLTQIARKGLFLVPVVGAPVGTSLMVIRWISAGRSI
jgi:hypothetical protein